MPIGRKRTIKATGQLSTSDAVKLKAIMLFARKQGKIISERPPVMRVKKGSR
jgi:hypothetical protein